MARRGQQPPPGVQQELFEERAESHLARYEPLAARMRPREIEGFIGQEHVVGPGRPLRQMIELDELTSIILWGPPGSGKTTLARIIAESTERYFAELSAVSSGVADVRKLIDEARERLRVSDRRTILFLDELHRFNRAQQDHLLPHVEAGVVTLIGATTENPSFYLVAPLLSRSRVFQLHLLEPDEIVTILRRALDDSTFGLGATDVAIEEETLRLLAQVSGGDARSALNVLDLAVAVADLDADGARAVTSELVDQAAEQRPLLYDREGDAHYDTISAYIKTLRDSDPDGALYWLARMLEAGEDALFVARRLVILAAEDVGLADPQALPMAVAAQQAVQFIGMPEGRIPLAEATVYLARAPKSNSAYAAYERAAKDARATRNEPVPMHLRNASTGLTRDLGYGRGYKYAHDFEDHVPPAQTHRPDAVEGRRYYEPGTLGDEPHDQVPSGDRPVDGGSAG